MTAAELTDDDRALLAGIMGATDPARLARLIFSYYHDTDRADRTPRGQVYLHIGMLCGAVVGAALSSKPRP